MALFGEHSQHVGGLICRRDRMRRVAFMGRRRLWLVLLAAMACHPSPARAVETIYPVADGTLVDGGIYGQFDGRVDRSQWAFDSTGFGGAVTLATAVPASAVEQRVVFEYDLREVRMARPVVATLRFTVRSASVAPFPDIPLRVYSYPADLMETSGDFSARPAVHLGTVFVPAQPSDTTVSLDVSDAVNAALAGDRMIGFRFQIAPNSGSASNQVFIDAPDASPMMKPTLIIGGNVAGDADSDGDVDLSDFATLTDCLTGPDVPPVPSGGSIDPVGCLWIFDRDGDADVDLVDHSAFLLSFERD